MFKVLSRKVRFRDINKNVVILKQGESFDENKVHPEYLRTLIFRRHIDLTLSDKELLDIVKATVEDEKIAEAANNKLAPKAKNKGAKQ